MKTSVHTARRAKPSGRHTGQMDSDCPTPEAPTTTLHHFKPIGCDRTPSAKNSSFFTNFAFTARFLPFFLMFLVSAGCSLFDTRPAEPPDSGTTGVFLQPDRPEVVIDNLISAVENLNTLNYMRCLDSESFQFAPSNPALQTNPDVWPNWSLDEEQIYFNNLRAAAENISGHQLQLTNITTEVRGVNQRQVIADYSLTILHNRGSAGVPTFINGRLILDLIAGEDGLWSISEWSDISPDGGYSWSDLKASFLSN